MTMLAAIQAITFDLDDTLWDTLPVIRAAEEELFQWLALRYPEVARQHDIDSLKTVRMKLASEHPERAHDLTWLRRESLRRVGEAAGYSGEAVADGGFEVFIAARHNVAFFDDALPALTQLRRSFRLAALSNGNADVYRLGLEHIFEFALSAVDVGMAKPHSAMFEAARQRLGVAPHEILHVGDHPEHDIEGAAAVGLRTAWINRDGQAWSGNVQPDLEVADLQHLVVTLLPSNRDQCNHD
ncbi:MAG: hypothetical protein AMJ69_05590 [Gammaproteobacteria bacterium SG8_47]|nr:MAG: hypothetical protein AMJ69_05590 [Gammaproteobacteria bacterium SG8_47]